MKNITSACILLAAAAIVFATSCKKKADPMAGKGGTAMVVLLPQHHFFAWPISACKVYVKYNARDTPNPLVYDDSAVCVCADSIVTCTFTNLKNGDYYFYGLGTDTNVQRTVGGGLWVPVSTQNSKNTDALAISEL